MKIYLFLELFPIKYLLKFLGLNKVPGRRYFLFSGSFPHSSDLLSITFLKSSMVYPLSNNSIIQLVTKSLLVVKFLFDLIFK